MNNQEERNIKNISPIKNKISFEQILNSSKKRSNKKKSNL